MNTEKQEFNELRWYKEALKKQLKPCPFCGKDDIVIHVPTEDGKEEVKCLYCGTTIVKAIGMGVVQWWNTRDGILKQEEKQ